jgi:hypothetical protein
MGFPARETLEAEERLATRTNAEERERLRSEWAEATQDEFHALGANVSNTQMELDGAVGLSERHTRRRGQKNAILTISRKGFS